MADDSGGPSVIDDWMKLPDDFSLEQSSYNFDHRAFPSDLGKPGYNGHYMVINIAVSNNSNMESVSGPGSVNGKARLFERLNQDLSKVDSLRNNIDTQYKGANGATLGYGGAFLPRFTRRIKESIALYMPGTMTFTTNNVYEDVSLTELGKSAISWGASMMQGALGRKGGALGNTDAVLGAAGTAAKAGGLAINPRVEVLFSNTTQRQFQFDFVFAPETEKESQDLEHIIYTLRFHAAPEMNSLPVLGGVLWTVPSEFDITFYNRGVENRAIPRINTCVLEQIDVDYAPQGQWATFSNGYPTQIRLQLRFRETEANHRLRILQGF